MKPLRGINMMGNCWISYFSPKPFLINSQLITKPRDVPKKIVGFKKTYGQRDNKMGLSLLSIIKMCVWHYNNRRNL